MKRIAISLLALAISMPLAATGLAEQSPGRGDSPPAAQAGTGTAPASDDRDGLGADIKAFIVSPLRWQRRDWFELAAAVGAVGAAYSADDRARDHFHAEAADPDNHDADDAIPAFVLFAGTLAGAALTRDRDGLLEARSMLEAAAFATATSYVAKEAAGRLRPYETADRSAWRAGGDSFPSVHTSAAFAIGAVLAESGNDRYRWIRRIVGYGVALGTAYRRLDHREHWASDTVAGAAIGIASARFVMRRRDPRQRQAQTSIMPTEDGFALVYSVALD